MATAVIVLAGGSGARLQRSGSRPENKVLLPLAGRPVLAWSVATFDASPLIRGIVVVARAGDHRRVEELLAAEFPQRLPEVVVGGPTRHASERAGVEALAGEIADGRVDLLCVHDAARPFVSHALLAAVIRRAATAGGALPGLPLVGTVVRGDDGGVVEPVAPADLRRVQTPQAFAAHDLLAAHRAAAGTGFAGVDTAQVVERFGSGRPMVVPGDPLNVKITFERDLAAAERIAATWSPGAA